MKKVSVLLLNETKKRKIGRKLLEKWVKNELFKQKKQKGKHKRNKMKNIFGKNEIKG